jgi:putative intracellular protease/amidase
VKGRSVTCISDEEEASCALPKGSLPTAKFSLSEHLQKDGAVVQHGGVWKEHVVVDGRLVRRPRFIERRTHRHRLCR